MAKRRLRVFRSVAKHLSFTKVAGTLFMTQPVVTFQIKRLKDLRLRGHKRVAINQQEVSEKSDATSGTRWANFD